MFVPPPSAGSDDPERHERRPLTDCCNTEVMTALWQDLLVAATGPVVTAALALVVLKVVTDSAQERRAELQHRERLVNEATSVATRFTLPLNASGEPPDAR